MPHPTSTRSAPTAVQSTTPAVGSVAGGTRIVIRGSGLAAVRTVALDDTAVELVARTATSLTVVTPASAGFEAGRVALQLRGKGGKVLDSSTYGYAVTSAVDRELHDALRYWKHYNPAYGPLADDDCVDFTGQVMLSRGWKPAENWVPDAKDIYSASTAWCGSN